MGTPHKHADVIKAWADGKDIEFLDTLSREMTWRDATRPSWSLDTEYRVKPKFKPDVVEEMSVYRNLSRRFDAQRGVGERVDVGFIGNMRLTWDGETRKLKSAEVLK